MVGDTPIDHSENPLRRVRGPAFSEAPAWHAVGKGWRHLHGSFRDLGFSLEWHDFTTDADLDWSRSFHPGSVEICLNLSGHADVQTEQSTLVLTSQSAGFYSQTTSSLRGVRRAREHHQFITVELSREFVRRHLSCNEANIHPQLAAFVSRQGVGCSVSESVPLSTDHLSMVMSLRKPPVFAAAQRLWYHAKALEVASAFFYKAPPEQELFCQQQKQLNQERAKRVIAVLKENLAEPPNLEEIARRVGCSPFYLSRIFSQQIGQTMTQYLRQLRMERAAQMLLEGKLKITSIALEVGYSSPSHFSTAFHETFGCCPGLYPLRTTSQRRD